MSNHNSSSKEHKSSVRSWAYLRDSSSQGQGVNQQLDQITAHCNRFGLLLDQVFIDKGVIGTGTMERNAFNDLLESITDSDNRPALLLVLDFSRISRNPNDFQRYRDFLQMSGVLVHSITDSLPDVVVGA